MDTLKSAIEDKSTPILPAHIEDTIRSIAKLHAEHEEQASPLQRIVDRLTASFGRPSFVGAITLIVFAWIAINLLLSWAGATPFDPPPFDWLQGALALMALYMTAFILTTQRYADQLAGYREQLTLELAILSEQKAAKIIALLEELRRDDPLIRDRIDLEAREMSEAADPEAVLEAIKDAHEIGVEDARETVQ